MRGLWLLGALAACDAASSDPGLDAVLQVKDAQFRPGPFPADEGGPAALNVQTKHSELVVGRNGEAVRGTLEPAARGIVLGIDGYDGTWLLPASPPDLDSGTNPTAKASIGISDALPPGPFTLRVAASNAEGRFGASATQMVIATPADEPTGELVITLRWDGPADLDVHAVAPDGEAWSDDPNTWTPPPPGEPVDPNAWKAGGILDHDGNKDCVREGHPAEHVIWQMPPPDGAYAIRVDARRMCGAASETWYVEASRSGTLIGAARGVSTEDDTELQHGAGAGALALTFSCDASGCR